MNSYNFYSYVLKCRKNECELRKHLNIENISLNICKAYSLLYSKAILYNM